MFKALGNKVDDKYYFYAKTLNERTGVIGEEAMAANKADDVFAPALGTAPGP